ncbi:hypothetical protein [Phycicoccus avicenniae]|uniref:hypothetical protein n=1 Tax=Phycicoccus avicenniae TaxID=2828860 RepID=UPI003D284A0B
MGKWRDGLYGLVFVGLVIASDLGGDSPVTLPLASASAGGFLMGVIWQRFNRKDVVGRLTWLAAVFGVFSVVGLVMWPSASVKLSGILFHLGVMSGVIVTEAWLRRRRAPRVGKLQETTSERTSSA